MRIEPIGSPIEEKAVEVAGLLSGWTADAVGGRNLLEKTGGDYLSTAGHTYNPSIVEVDGKKALAFNSSRNIINLVGTDVELKEGDKISFSFKAKASKPLSIGHVYIAPGWGNGRLLRDQMVTTEWTEYSISYTVTTAGPVHVHMYPLIDNEDGTYETFYITEWKLEYGLKPTPWTPAPEDLNRHIQKGNTLDTLPSPLPPADPATAIRVDNSVGTRVFVGDTMIYGDTGRRDMSAEYTDSIELDGELHEMTLSRENNMVSLEVIGKAKDVTGIAYITTNLPLGFRLGGSGYGVVGAATVDGSLVAVGNVNSRHRISLSGPGSSPAPGVSVTMRISWPTPDPWPTSLPGTPG